MNYKDFENLKLGQWLYTSEGKARMINGLSHEPKLKCNDLKSACSIRFSDDPCWYVWSCIDFCYHLEKPKQKKRYWLWSYDYYGAWNKTSYYLNDEGKATDGVEHLRDWSNRTKIKHENEFIEV